MNLKQVIRLIDVFYIGVILIWIAFRFDLPVAVKVQLVILGGATIIYNGYNWVKERQKENLIKRNEHRIVHLPDLNVQEGSLRKILNENYNIKLTY